VRGPAATLIALAAACASCGGGDVAAPPAASAPAASRGAAAPPAATRSPSGAPAATSSADAASQAPATGAPPASRTTAADAGAPAEPAPSTPESRESRNRAVLAEASKTIADPRFSAFRGLAEPYLAVVREMRPLDEKFAAGTITESERAAYWKLDARKSELWTPLHQHMYEARWSKDDRRAMGQWLMLTAQDGAAR
jgi:hypothetical protein